MPTPTDSAIVRDVRDRIGALNRFGSVLLGAGPGQEEVAPDREAACWVQRAGWREAERTPAERLRDLQVRIWIDVWGDDPDQRSDLLDGLERAVCAALNGQALGGCAMPAFTTVATGAEENRPATKSSRSVLTLSCRYQRM